MLFKKVEYVSSIPVGKEYVLVGDIGGTNANFGFFSIEGISSVFLFSLHLKSQEIVDFASTVASVIEYARETYNITIKQSCFAAAGVVSENRDYCKPTNLSFALRSEDIIKKTGLDTAYLVNDFEIIGYGLSKINQKDLIQVNRGIVRKGANKVILGAGTGLGKCMLRFSVSYNRYIPLASEGGHADFAAQDQLEYDLVHFIKHKEERFCNISWEDVLSGNGIKRMYSFFKERNTQVSADTDLVKNGLHPDEIFNNKNKDEHAFNTFVLYTKLYARCAKNFALDGLGLAGVYIAGGIAAKNLPLFKEEAFMREFVNCGKQAALLEEVPIFVIADYNVSLYGVAEFLALKNLYGDF